MEKTKSVKSLLPQDLKLINDFLDDVRVYYGDRITLTNLEEIIMKFREKIFNDIELNHALNGKISVKDIIAEIRNSNSLPISNAKNEIFYTFRIKKNRRKEKLHSNRQIKDDVRLEEHSNQILLFILVIIATFTSITFFVYEGYIGHLMVYSLFFLSYQFVNREYRFLKELIHVMYANIILAVSVMSIFRPWDDLMGIIAYEIFILTWTYLRYTQIGLKFLNSSLGDSVNIDYVNILFNTLFFSMILFTLAYIQFLFLQTFEVIGILMEVILGSIIFNYRHQIKIGGLKGLDMIKPPSVQHESIMTVEPDIQQERNPVFIPVEPSNSTLSPCYMEINNSRAKKYVNLGHQGKFIRRLIFIISGVSIVVAIYFDFFSGFDERTSFFGIFRWSEVPQFFYDLGVGLIFIWGVLWLTSIVLYFDYRDNRFVIGSLMLKQGLLDYNLITQPPKGYGDKKYILILSKLAVNGVLNVKHGVTSLQ